MLREGPVRTAAARADDVGVGTRAAIYARVSTVAGQSPQMQIEVLREYAARRGLRVASDFVDHGVSGVRAHRPGLDRLMAGAHQRAFDVVLVYRFDRFARGVRHLVTALEEFQALGVEFVSYSESLDTSTPMGRAMFAIVAALAALERDIIVERSVEGQRRARARHAHGSTAARDRRRAHPAPARRGPEPARHRERDRRVAHGGHARGARAGGGVKVRASEPPRARTQVQPAAPRSGARARGGFRASVDQVGGGAVFAASTARRASSQARGVSSAIRAAGCVDTRWITSRRYSQGSIPRSLQLPTRV